MGSRAFRVKGFLLGFVWGPVAQGPLAPAGSSLLRGAGWDPPRAAKRDKHQAGVEEHVPGGLGFRV